MHHASLAAVVCGLMERGVATLRYYFPFMESDAADHAFHVPARSGRTDADVRREMLEVLSEWIAQTTGT